MVRGMNLRLVIAGVLIAGSAIGIAMPDKIGDRLAGNVAEVETAVNRFRESVQTVSMFGGRRVVWLKDVNFLADTVTGRAESTLKLVSDLQEILEKIDPAETAVLITASPIDRTQIRRPVAVSFGTSKSYGVPSRSQASMCCRTCARHAAGK